MNDCVKRLIEKSNGVFDKQSAKELLDDISRMAAKKARAGFDEDDAIKDVLAEYAMNVKENLQKQKLNAYRNLAKNKALNNRLSAHIEKGLTPDKAFIAELEGTEVGVTGGRYSADQATQAIQNATLGALVNDLGDLLPVLNSRRFTNEIANELRILEDGNGKSSGNREAKRIAQIIHKHKEISRIRANRAGADISKIDGHTMLQTHDPYKMRRMGEENWKAFIRPLLDEKKTFDGNAEDLDKALSGAYKALTTGVRLNNPLDVKAAKLFQFEGPANLGKKLSRARELIFKDADSFLQYNNAMGKTDFNDAIISMMTRQAHDIALLERYGTNPKAQLETAYKQTLQKHRDILKTAPNQERIQDIINEITGDRVTPTAFSRVASNIRLYQTVTKLGAVVLSSITDIPFKALAYQYHGKSILSSYVQPFLDIAQGFKSKAERTKYASLLQVGMEGMMGDIAGRVSEVDNLSKRAQKLSRLYFKLNGLSWWTDTHKLAMGKVLSHDLALQRKLPFDKLSEETKRSFNQYAITAKEWDHIREGFKKMEDGREYLFAEHVNNQAAADKLSAYYTDSVDHGVISPGARERRYTAIHSQRGTPAGEVIRTLMQFKTFPTTAVTRAYGRALYSKGKADIPMMIQLMIMTSAFGYIAMSAKDITRGKTPKDPTKTKTIMAAVAQGGGFSIAGDIAFGTRGLLNVAAGPTGSQADDLVKILQDTREGSDTKARSTKWLADSLAPNLFYVKPALDSLIRAHVYEELNPGYTSRMERKMKQDYGQEYYK